MSKKCRAFSESKLGLEASDNRKAFYAGWEAALAQEQAVSVAELQAALGWPGGISNPVSDKVKLLRMVADLRAEPEPVAWRGWRL